MDLYKTGMLVTMFLCVRGIDCIYGPAQDRNVSDHVCVCVRGSIFVFMDLYKTGMLVAMFLSGGSIVPLSTILIFDFGIIIIIFFLLFYL